MDVYAFKENSSVANTKLPDLDAIPDPYKTCVIVLYMCTAIFAFVINVIALLVLFVVKKTSHDLLKYLANLAIADISISLLLTPFTYTDFMFGNWVFPHILCPIVNFAAIVSVFVSVYTLIAIGIGRFFAIVYPLQSSLWIETHTTHLIVIIWMIGICLGSPQLYVTRATAFKYRNETLYDCREGWEGDINSKLYTVILFTVTFLVPIIALTFLYGSIGITIMKRISPGNSDSARDEAQFVMRVKVVKMLVILVITFVLCWLPLQIFQLVMWLFDDIRKYRGLTQQYLYVGIYFTCHWLFMAHSFVNPIIYCFMSNNFKLQDLKFTFRKICSRIGLCHFNNYMNGYVNDLASQKSDHPCSHFQASPSRAYYNTQESVAV